MPRCKAAIRWTTELIFSQDSPKLICQRCATSAYHPWSMHFGSTTSAPIWFPIRCNPQSERSSQRSTSLLERGGIMNVHNSWLWKALVWVLLPFTLGAGLPHWECLCAARKGLSHCERCRGGKLFRSCCSGQSCCSVRQNQSSPPAAHACCRDQSRNDRATQTTCVKNPVSGGCCRLKIESPVPVPAPVTATVDQSLNTIFLADLNVSCVRVGLDLIHVSAKLPGAVLLPSERLATFCRWLI
jgi:hypothetical protein